MSDFWTCRPSQGTETASGRIFIQFCILQASKVINSLSIICTWFPVPRHAWWLSAAAAIRMYLFAFGKHKESFWRTCWFNGLLFVTTCVFPTLDVRSKVKSRCRSAALSTISPWCRGSLSARTDNVAVMYDQLAFNPKPYSLHGLYAAQIHGNAVHACRVNNLQHCKVAHELKTMCKWRPWWKVTDLPSRRRFLASKALSSTCLSYTDIYCQQIPQEPKRMQTWRGYRSMTFRWTTGSSRMRRQHDHLALFSVICWELYSNRERLLLFS